MGTSEPTSGGNSGLSVQPSLPPEPPPFQAAPSHVQPGEAGQLVVYPSSAPGDRKMESPAERAASPEPNPPIPETTPLQSAFSSGDETPHDGGSSHTGGHGRTLGVFMVFARHREDTWESATATPHVPLSATS